MDARMPAAAESTPWPAHIGVYLVPIVEVLGDVPDAAWGGVDDAGVTRDCEKEV